MKRRDPGTCKANGGAALAVALSTIVLSACGASTSTTADGQFAAGTKDYPLSCMDHQTQAPGRTYTAAGAADTAVILTMLKYYTANKDVTRYCDGKAPTATDRSWAQAYVALGSAPRNVSHIIGGAAARAAG